jgi:prevent-host-death family protein
MKKASVSEVKARFSAFLNESQRGPVVVMSNGKPIAVLLGVQDEDEFDRLVFASSRRLQDILAAGRREIREGRGIPNEEFWKQVEAEQPRKKRNRGKKTPKTRSRSMAPRIARLKPSAGD